MNITQVYLTPDYDTTEDRSYLGKYQNETTYIQLFIEDCFRKNKVDLGVFNRIVFSEDGDSSRDFSIVGNNALQVALTKTYSELQATSSDREAHEYYVQKFLEGFKKLDANFLCSFTDYLKPLIEKHFNTNLFYEKKIATKRVENFRLDVMARYSRKAFNLVVNVFEKNNLIKSKSVYECEPDLFISKFDVHKVEISTTDLVVINKIRKNTLEMKIAEII